MNLYEAFNELNKLYEELDEKSITGKYKLGDWVHIKNFNLGIEDDIDKDISHANGVIVQIYHREIDPGIDMISTWIVDTECRGSNMICDTVDERNIEPITDKTKIDQIVNSYQEKYKNRNVQSIISRYIEEAKNRIMEQNADSLADKPVENAKKSDTNSSLEKPANDSTAEETPAEEPKKSNKYTSAQLTKARQNNAKLYKALAARGFDVSKLRNKKKDKNGKEYSVASDELNKLRKEIFGEAVYETVKDYNDVYSLLEYINE